MVEHLALPQTAQPVRVVERTPVPRPAQPVEVAERAPVPNPVEPMRVAEQSSAPQTPPLVPAVEHKEPPITPRTPAREALSVPSVVQVGRYVDDRSSPRRRDDIEDRTGPRELPSGPRIVVYASGSR
ncbi:hypothetical protein ALO43_200445 [Pseudomonas tremae]|uniref:Chemotaxis protein methyltransferase WspC n=1 Tax=Pseudomonas tremae TaxID=200454 RepID=A0AA40TSN3_9PSED|nr:hypothetical protein ALO43_200445 [Pseudomonas tremae]